MAFFSLNSSALTAVGNAKAANKGINNLGIKKRVLPLYVRSTVNKIFISDECDV